MAATTDPPEKILVIFKTHLDLGFTGLAKDILQRYLTADIGPDGTLPEPEAGAWFCLYNNVWGTNFPMWYGEDARFRFELTFTNEAEGQTKCSIWE